MCDVYVKTANTFPSSAKWSFVTHRTQRFLRNLAVQTSFPSSAKWSFVTHRTQRFLRNLAVQTRKASHSDLQKRFRESGFSGSVASVRRSLYSMEFKCRRPIRTPKLTPSMVRKCFVWVNLHKDMPVEY
ncbi:hypothetical protein QE152_g24920 [Popillia japonica]|uniref:Transposase Tc1-like domain-containing protein n=1 Tax=Popillia japonica TaxID=7064 RepID=A0AAW1K2Y9_POPJA